MRLVNSLLADRSLLITSISQAILLILDLGIQAVKSRQMLPNSILRPWMLTAMLIFHWQGKKGENETNNLGHFKSIAL